MTLETSDLGDDERNPEGTEEMATETSRKLKKTLRQATESENRSAGEVGLSRAGVVYMANLMFWSSRVCDASPIFAIVGTR